MSNTNNKISPWDLDIRVRERNLKNVDALVHVVRAFEDANIPHPEGSIDPGRDIGLFELEMIFSDLAIIEKRLERLEKGSAGLRRR